MYCINWFSFVGRLAGFSFGVGGCSGWWLCRLFAIWFGCFGGLLANWVWCGLLVIVCGELECGWWCL